MYKCVHFTHHQPSLSGVQHCAAGLRGEIPDDLHTVSYRKTRMHDNVCELKDKKKKTYKCYSQKFHFTYHCDKKKNVLQKYLKMLNSHDRFSHGDSQWA